MQVVRTSHWHRLRVLLDRDPRTAGRILRRYCPEPLPEKAVLDELHELAQTRRLSTLFELHLVSALALPENKPPHQLPPLPALAALGLVGENLQQTLWSCLPILVYQAETAKIVWLLLGRMDDRHGCTLIGDPRPDAGSQQAATTALTASGCLLRSPTYGFVALPLQHPTDPPLTGGSLALPLALGMRLLAEGKHWPRHIYASGGLNPDGRILAVGGEPLKYSLVAPEMRLLLYPETGLLHAIPDDKVARCTDLHQAFSVLDCLLAGADAPEIARYRACLASPELFLRDYPSLPAALLNLPAGRELLDRIRQDRRRLLPDLAHCLMSCRNDPDRSGPLVDLFTPEEIAAIAQQGDAVFDACSWCQARIAVANRAGHVAESRAWIELAHALGADGHVEDCPNHIFITDRFNRYEFQPALPEDFAAFLDREQRAHEMNPRPNRALGAMYGTLAQNYGFCGQACRDLFFDCIRKADNAFGPGQYRQELQRLLAYQIYWLLDAAEYDQAQIMLNRYLKLPEGSSPLQWIDALQALSHRPDEHAPFQIALVCRLLAELAQVGRLVPEPVWCRSLTNLLPASTTTHPWPMTTHNLGRLFLAAGLEQQGLALLHRSAEDCAHGGITQVPMTLSALATLHLHQPENRQVPADAARILQAICASDVLHQPHFQPLLDAPTPEAALRLILADPGRYFPFSYR